MDVARFEVLEKRVKALAQSFDQTKVENRQLRRQVDRLQQTVATQQQTLEHLQRERDRLVEANEAVQVLRQEREVIQEKLRHMLETIEWLEKNTAVSRESPSG